VLTWSDGNRTCDKRCGYPKGKSSLLARGDLDGSRFGFFLGYFLAQSRMQS